MQDPMLRCCPGLLAVIVLGALAMSGCGGSAADGRHTQVGIGEATIEAEVALTAEERSLGLSGREFMPEDEGMLFVLGEERVPSFTMRGMRFPLDFVWISGDRRVVDLTEDVPHPVEDENPVSSVQPSRAAAYVLELNAGAVETLGIEVGDEVSFSPDVSPEDAS